MADIRMICPMCSTGNVFSEYSDESARVCRQCGLSLHSALTGGQSQEPSAVQPLRVREQTRKKPPPIPATAAVDHADPIPTAGRAAPLPGADRSRGMGRWGLLLSLLGFSGLLIGAQALSAFSPPIESAYLNGRYGAVALGALLILVEAFRDSAGQGFLCLLAPFYILYYGLTRVQSYWRQGLTLALLAMIVSELHFIPKRAMIHELGDWTSAQVDGVGRSIQRAGDAPAP
ncbi:MAG: hypothetical protein U1E27_06890 [Kiritimatiellia bacterium]|nr:hypothetical protein [Kiritimatiellia bacterium]